MSNPQHAALVEALAALRYDERREVVEQADQLAQDRTEDAEPEQQGNYMRHADGLVWLGPTS